MNRRDERAGEARRWESSDGHDRTIWINSPLASRLRRRQTEIISNLRRRASHGLPR